MFWLQYIPLSILMVVSLLVKTKVDSHNIEMRRSDLERDILRTRDGQNPPNGKLLRNELPHWKSGHSYKLDNGHFQKEFLKRQIGSPDVDDLKERFLGNVYGNAGNVDDFVINNTEDAASYRQEILDPNAANTIRVPHPYPFQPLHIHWPPNMAAVQIIPKAIPIHHFKPVPIAVHVPKYKSFPDPYYVPYKTSPDYDVTHVHVYHPENPCRNGGFPVESHFGYHCLCSRDYRGRFCDEKLYCTSSPCQNGGVCEEIENNYRCQCNTGYMGYNCEEKDACSPNPCKNDGQCVERSSGYKCYCRSGFTGKICEDLDYCDPNPCQNGGTCEQRHGFHECICQQQFRGKVCERRRICFSNPCKNGGKCVENDEQYPCICPHGYSPPHCRVHVCSSGPCLNGGKCVPKQEGYYWSYRCVCSILYKGDKCEIPNPCVTNPCLNGGTCIDTYSKFTGFPKDWDMGYLHYYCMCPPDHSGEKCEDNLCLKCDTNANCIHGRCVCEEGYRGNGLKCAAIENPCAPNPCQNNGTCSKGPDGSFDCSCPEGFFPPLCTKPPNPCVSNPCSNNGICVIDNRDTFHCICPADYLPPDCRNKTVDLCVPNPCQNGASCKPSENKKRFTCNCKGSFKPPLCTCDCPKGDPYRIPPILSQTCEENGDCYCPSYNGISHTMTEKGCVEARQDPCNSNPCQNGGKCFSGADKLSFFCQCPEECTGKRCQDCNPGVICKPGYCKNGGTCVVVGRKPFCQCPPSYLPPNCIKHIVISDGRSPCHPNPCQNGGSCRAADFKSYQCICLRQYEGEHCDRDKCEDCDVHALCYNGDCTCRSGYKGSGIKGDCKQDSLCKRCPLNAICVDSECVCIKDFYFINNTCRKIVGS